MSERKLEHCCECDCPTGRAGRSDDSLYFGDFGPFCEDCYDALPDKINEEISQLRAQLANQAKSYQRVIQEEYGKREALDAQLAEAQKVEPDAIKAAFLEGHRAGGCECHCTVNQRETTNGCLKCNPVYAAEVYAASAQGEG